MFGFKNKKDLTKWDDEDLARAKGCKWMEDKQFQMHKDKVELKKEVKWWYEKLCQNLPTPELYKMQQDMKGLSLIWNTQQVAMVLKTARYDMVQKLIAYEYQKEKMVKEYAEKIPVNTNTFEDNRVRELTKPLPKDSPQWQKQRDEQVLGYMPTVAILTKLPPMEILDYVGFRLVKYDKYHGYFAAMVIFPKELNRTIEIIFDPNPQIVESKSEYIFEIAIENYLNSKANPYGGKSFKDVDISNVKQAMGGNTGNDPLSKEIF